MHPYEPIVSKLIEWAMHDLVEGSAFEPFGVGVRHDDEMALVHYLHGGQEPAQIANGVLRNAKAAMEKGDFKAVGVALDVMIKPPYGNEKVDAIRMDALAPGYPLTSYFQPYFWKDGQVHLLPFFSECDLRNEPEKPQATMDDYGRLVQKCYEWANKVLIEGTKLYPFAIVLEADDNTQILYSDNLPENLHTNQIHRILAENIKKHFNNYKAVAFGCHENIWAEEHQSLIKTIRVTAHADGFPANVCRQIYYYEKGQVKFMNVLFKEDKELCDSLWP